MSPSSRPSRRLGLIPICNSLGLTSAREAGTGVGSRPAVHSARRTSRTVGFLRSGVDPRRIGRRIVQGANRTVRKFGARAARLKFDLRIALKRNDLINDVIRRSKSSLDRLEAFDGRYKVSESLVTATCLTAAMNFGGGAFVLGVKSLAGAAVSAAIAERARRRRDRRSRSSSLGRSSSRSFQSGVGVGNDGDFDARAYVFPDRN